jgi:hypothetical protein
MGQAITLPRGTATVGRAVGCLLVINDPGVSRQHLKFHVGRQVFVEDLGSQNGTWINGQRIDGRRTLADGDQITVGSRSFTLRIVEELPYTEDCPTATGDTRAGTMLGVGAVVQRACHKCGCDLPIDAERCPRCDHTWRSSEAKSSTEENAEVSAATAAQRLRRHARHPISLPARYISATLNTEGTAMDISLGGAFVSASQIDAVGTSCTLLISARGGKGSEVLIKGFVRNAIHRGRTGMGIEFASVDEKQRRWLEALLSAARPESS